MTELGLRANPAVGASALIRQGHTAADPAGGRRRLTAESFRALTRRLKELPPLSPPSVFDEPMLAIPDAALPDPADDAGPAWQDDDNASQVASNGAEIGAALGGDNEAVIASDAGEGDEASVPSLADLPPPLFADELQDTQSLDDAGSAMQPRVVPPAGEDLWDADLAETIGDEAENSAADAVDAGASETSEEHAAAAAPVEPLVADVDVRLEADTEAPLSRDDEVDASGDGNDFAADQGDSQTDEPAIPLRAALQQFEMDALAAPIEDADEADGAHDVDAPEDEASSPTYEEESLLDELDDAAGDAAAGGLQDMLRQLQGQFGTIAESEGKDGLAGGETAADDWAAGARHLREEQDGEDAASTVEEAGAVDVGAVDEASSEPDSGEPAALPAPEPTTDEPPFAAGDLSALLGNFSERFADVGQDHVQGETAPLLDSGAETEAGAIDLLELDLPTDEASGETAKMLLDIMSMPSGAIQPQERALAADTLLRLIARMPVKAVVALAERFSLMESPPGLVIKQLISHPNDEIAALVLEKCANVTDQDLLDLIANCPQNKLRMIARRRHLSSALVDALIARGGASVFLTIVRNPGADISYDAFIELCELAKTQPSLQAPLATRANTPAPVAFELFWFLPSELRRYVLSRFLTDSETLAKILKITLAVDASADTEVTERQFPARARIEELAGLIEEGLTPEASRLMASLSGICEACARRLIADPDGEPLTIIMKAMGATRALFSAALERWQSSTSAMLRNDRNLDELRNLFDSMSFNKARVLLTYWDWAARKAGPYARRAA